MILIIVEISTENIIRNNVPTVAMIHSQEHCGYLGKTINVPHLNEEPTIQESRHWDSFNSILIVMLIEVMIVISSRDIKH